MSTVTIIDYALGNMKSVARACEFLGARVQIAHDAESIDSASRLILPGVGSFEAGMLELQNRNLASAIKSYSSQNRPLLGICLGMQMLLDSSEEFGEHAGLGIIPGRVRSIPSSDSEGISHKIPHIGWSELTIPKTSELHRDQLLNNLPAAPSVYFVHSYTAWPEFEIHRAADTFYGGQRISAIIRKGGTVGCQFHPEKSGPLGLQILRNFLDKNLG